MKAPGSSVDASALIDQRIKELGDWRGKTLARVRKLIHQAEPGVVEEWKWRGVPVWSHNGILCTGETYKSVVKLTLRRAPRLKTLLDCSTQALKETSGAQSTFTRPGRSMK